MTFVIGLIVGFAVGAGLALYYTHKDPSKVQAVAEELDDKIRKAGE